MLRDMIMQELPKLLRFVKPSGTDNMGGPCPFHGGGEEKNPSFYVNVNNGLFFCHACGVKGTFVQFLKRMGVRSDKIDLLARVADEEQPKKKRVRALDHKGTYILSETILGALDYCPEDLLSAGFDMKLLHSLDVGFDHQAMRITYPIRDLYGNLVGIAGRTVTNAIPRYLVYRAEDLKRFAPMDEPEKYANYQTIKNHEYIWNMHNVFPGLFYGEEADIIVVEGYKACMWLLQHGYTNTVALMGSHLTAKQEALLAKLKGTIFLFLDHNPAGWGGTFEAGRALTNRGKTVRVFSYPLDVEEGAQPDSLFPEELEAGLNKASPFASWRRTNATHIGRSQVTIKADRNLRTQQPKWRRPQQGFRA